MSKINTHTRTNKGIESKLVVIDSHEQNDSLYYFDRDEVFVFENKKVTYYGFIMEGRAHLFYEDLEIPLKQGMYFCVPGSNSSLVGGKGAILKRNEFVNAFSVGGPFEENLNTTLDL